MTAPDFLGDPDQHLDPTVAAAYDEAHADHFDAAVVDAAVERLATLAGSGPVVEFAIGTGRIALPLARRGVDIRGVDISAAMLGQLAAKPGADTIEVVEGDMTTTRLADDATLVYLVFNTITNLRTQELQVACFANAAAQLAVGGRFVVENGVPALARLAPGERFRPFTVDPGHLGIDEFVDPVAQISRSHHWFIDGDRVRTISGTFRYVWPSELDLMAQLAGLELEHRWADWAGSPFTADASSHVSVWRKP